VEHFHSQLASLVELGARVLARDDVVGALRHRSGHLVSPGLDRSARFVARHCRERTRKHKSAGILPVTGGFFGFLEMNSTPWFSQAIDDVPIMRLPCEFLDTLGELGTDTLQRHLFGSLAVLFSLRVLLADRLLFGRELLPICLHEPLQRPEMPR